MKAYIISNSEDGMKDIDGIYYLLTEEGEVLASHWCSSKSFAMGDLYGKRPERIKEYLERFGEFTVEYLGHDDMTIERIFELNEKWWREHKEN